jgi:CPA2 family monovalent cation:H+ antiporter-2
MNDLGLVGNLAVVAAAALIGGVVARALRLPAILGYLAAGLVIGPNTPGFVEEIEEVNTIADLGVALLMFTLGIRFSFRELVRVRGVAIGGGLTQVALMIGVGFLTGITLGLDERESFLVGAVVAMSSTLVALRLLEGTGEIDRPSGRLAISISLVQDLSAVPLIVMIPVLAGDGEDFLVQLALAMGKAALLLTGVWLVGTVILPRVFSRVAAARTRELFLLTVVTLALGTASVSFLAGLSLAFGAFLAGILISESEYAHRTLAEVFPLREVFAVVFFVGIGMLIDPASFVDDPAIVFGVAAVGIFGKMLVIATIVAAFGYNGRTALTAGLALGSMAEFSFVLVREGAEEGVLLPGTSEAILAAVLLSIATTPLLYVLHNRILSWAQRAPALRPIFQRSERYVPEETGLVNHAVVCGYDEAGREVVEVLMQRGFRCLVIDEDPVAIRQLRVAGIPCVLGDPSLVEVLEQSALDRARVLVITLTDPREAEIVTAIANEINPRLEIIARGAGGESRYRLARAGADHVVHGEFEVGMEIVRHTLQRFGVSGPEIQAILGRRRRDVMRG